MTTTLTSGDLTALLTWTQLSDPATNTSRFRLDDLTFLSTRQYGIFWITGTLEVNGNCLVDFLFNNTTGSKVSLTLQKYAPIVSVGGGFSPPYTSQPISHAADGTGQVSIALKLVLMADGNYSIREKLEASTVATLATIARASTLTAAGGALGTALSIAITRADPALRDTVEYFCGSASGTIAEKTQEATLNWTPPLSLAGQNPNGTVLTATIRLTTWAGTASIGSRSVTVTLTIPPSVVPTAQVTLTDPTGNNAKYGGFLQGKSTLRVQVTPAGVWGSSITATSVNFGGITRSGTDHSFTLVDAGRGAVTVTVQDSRGRSAALTTQFDILPYAPPDPQAVTADRCTALGQTDPTGLYLRAEVAGSITSLSGKNTASYALEYRVRDSSAWSVVSLPELNGVYLAANISKILPADADSSYELRLKATDAFATVTGPITIVPGAFALLDICRDTRALGLGVRASTANAVSLGLALNMNGRRITAVGAPSEAGDALTLEAGDSRYWRSYKLWTNPKPTSVFGAQSVGADLSNCTMVLIESTAAAGSTVRNCTLCPVGYGGQLLFFTDGQAVVRLFQTSQGSVSFQAASGGNGNAVPLAIYGVTGMR